MTKKNNGVDLRKARIGQPLRRRDGAIVPYVGQDENFSIDSPLRHDAGEGCYHWSGKLWPGENSPVDIVAILTGPGRTIPPRKPKAAKAPKVKAQAEHALAVFNFLLGQGRLGGVNFSEANPKESGAYWWRTHLRMALAGLGIKSAQNGKLSIARRLERGAK